MYVVCWTSPNGSVAKAVYELHEINIKSGAPGRPAIRIHASADAQTALGKTPAKFTPSKQKQRAALLLTTPTFNGEVRKTLFAAFAMTHEEGDTSHGWLVAFDLKTFKSTAAFCTSPNGAGVGIWQAGAGPAADDEHAIYVHTGNYGVQDHGSAVPPHAGDLPESLIKLEYTLASDGTGRLEPVAFFTPFHDHDRNKNGDDNFQDYDLASAGPLPIPGLNLVVSCGKDGVAYVLDTDTAKMGKGSDFSKLKQPPIFFTYFPGFGIDASHAHNLDHLFDGKTHHLHCSSAFWDSPARGPMLFVWGENECLRAWTIDASGKINFVAKSTEVASAGLGGRGGMPGGILTISSNGSQPNTGIVWAQHSLGFHQAAA